MSYEKTIDMWLQRCADLPITYKCINGHQFIASIDKSYPSRMMMKVKRLKFIGVKQ